MTGKVAVVDTTFSLNHLNTRPLDHLVLYLQLPYSLPRQPFLGGQGSGRQGRLGLHGLCGRGGRRSQSLRGSRRTHTVRFPQLSTPSSTSAHSPGRQGFSIITRRQKRSSGRAPGPGRPSPNTGTRTQLSQSRSIPIGGYSGMVS